MREGLYFEDGSVYLMEPSSCIPGWYVATGIYDGTSWQCTKSRFEIESEPVKLLKRTDKEFVNSQARAMLGLPPLPVPIKDDATNQGDGHEKHGTNGAKTND